MCTCTRYIIHSSVVSTTMEDACSPNTMANAAIVASIAASNPKMVEALGGAQMFEAATAAIGILDVFPATGDEQVFPFDDDDVDPASPPIKKQRRVFARVRKEDSTWWIKFLTPEMRLDMETEIEGRVATKFR